MKGVSNMYNFNEQGKFESHEAAKEHSQNIEGRLPLNGLRKGAKDKTIGILSVIAMIAGVILFAYFMKG
jgi:hypothetical protein